MAAPKRRSGMRGRGMRETGRCDEEIAAGAALAEGGTAMAKMAAATSATEVISRKVPTLDGPEARTTMGQAVAPRPHVTFSMERRRPRTAGTLVPTITFPAVSPVPRPGPTQKSARGAGLKVAQAMMAHRTTE